MADLVTPMALRVAATLRVADHIASGVDDAAQLAATVHADADALERVLRHLVAVDVLSCDDRFRYSLTSLGEQLREDDPSGMRALLDTESALGRADLSFVRLLHSVYTGEPAFNAQFGRDFWDDLASEPARTASFDAQMSADVEAWAPSVVAALDWGSLTSVVDVGGGNGTLMAALLGAHPALHGTVFDQPATAESARQLLADAGLESRSAVVSGSFFDPLPPDAGGYLLCAILHDWNDQAAREILRRCAEAAGPRGAVVVVEKTGPDGESPSSAMDLRMLAYFGGRQRGVTELSLLAGTSGLHVAAVHSGDTLSILELKVAM